MFTKLVDGTSGDLVLLVRVAPDSNAEREYHRFLYGSAEKYGAARNACALGTIFGWPYNRYEIDFSSDLASMWFFSQELERVFKKARVRREEFHPTVEFAYKNAASPEEMMQDHSDMNLEDALENALDKISEHNNKYKAWRNANV